MQVLSSFSAIFSTYFPGIYYGDKLPEDCFFSSIFFFFENHNNNIVVGLFSCGFRFLLYILSSWFGVRAHCTREFPERISRCHSYIFTTAAPWSAALRVSPVIRGWMKNKLRRLGVRGHITYNIMLFRTCFL